MLERLFTSKTRVKLMTLFLMSADRELHVREIARLIDENINATRRELANLEDIGLLQSKKRGNLKQYRVNTSMPLYKELTAIVLKTEGVAKILKDHLSDLGSINLAFIYGSFAQFTAHRESDIDVFIVGSLDEKVLISCLHRLEKQLSREINYILFTPEEYKERVQKHDPFVSNVLREPKVVIIGDLNDS